MNCPVFVAHQAKLAAQREATKKAAKAAAQRLYRKTDKYKQYREGWHLNPSCKWAAFVAQARARGIEVTISKVEYMALVLKPCAYCGEQPPTKLRGIDRLDSNLTYSTENSVPCCAVCNFMKHTLSVAEFVNKAQQIATYQQNRAFAST